LWKSKIIGRATKVKIFNSNIKAVLVYASESWTITQRMTGYKLSSTNCEGFLIYTGQTELLTKNYGEKTGQEPVLDQIQIDCV